MRPATDFAETTDPAEAALFWFVRSRAEYFSPAERQALAAWLAANAAHRREYARLEESWRSLDVLAAPLATIPRARFAASSPPRPAWAWRWAAGGLAATVAVAFAFFLARPGETPQHYETAPGERATVSLAGGTTLVLSAGSALDFIDSRPPRLILKRGEIYLDLPPGSPSGVEVIVHGVRIKDVGTQFAVRATAKGGQVAIAAGRVEIRAGNSIKEVGPGWETGFTRTTILPERPIDARNVASWRHGQWWLDAVSLAELADELARQQGVQLDLAPEVAALTVSGRFDMNETERMLRAIAQVHGLAFKRLGKTRFVLAFRSTQAVTK